MILGSVMVLTIVEVVLMFWMIEEVVLKISMIVEMVLMKVYILTLGSVMVWMIVEVVLMNVSSNIRFCDGLDDCGDGSDES